MAVLRIVPNIATSSVGEVAAFYADLLDMNAAMDLAWIQTLAAGQTAPVQVSILSEGGSGAPAPDISIEVDDVDAVHDRALRIGLTIDYPITDEPWGVRRFFIRDPAGTLLNIISHST